MTPAFTVHSPETGTDYKVFVELPDLSRFAGPWPAVAFMDADNLFEPGVKGYRKEREDVPPLLLVGVGYGAGFGKPANKRLRDYTATSVATEPESGGAEAFHAFLKDTLWPELGRRYPIDPSRRGLAGHSLGSLFVLHALFRPKPYFTHFLASAPSIWWDERSLLADVKTLHKASPSLNGQLYLSVGVDDSESMTGDLKLLEEQLAAHPFSGLEIVSERFPNRDHFNVVSDAFGSGLRVLFGVTRE